MSKKKLKFNVPKDKKLKDKNLSAPKKIMEEESLFGDSIIKPTKFYSDETGKTKWNWFLYELALSVEMFIKKNLDQELRKWMIGEREIADFSIYAVGEIKDTILDAISRNSKRINFSSEVIESYFPGLIGSKLTDKILDALIAALEFQLYSCDDCFTQCLTQREQYCTMFNSGPFSYI